MGQSYYKISRGFFHSPITGFEALAIEAFRELKTENEKLKTTIEGLITKMETLLSQEQ